MSNRVAVGLSAVVALVILAVGLAVYLDDGGGGSGEPFEGSNTVEDAIIRVVVTPGTVGPTDVHLFVEDPAAGLEDTAEATASLSLGDDGIALDLVDSGKAHWIAEDVEVDTAGTWVLQVIVDRGGGDVLTTTFDVPIGGD